MSCQKGDIPATSTDLIINYRNNTYNVSTYGDYFDKLYNHMFSEYGMELCACNCQAFDIAVDGLNKYVHLLPSELQYSEKNLICQDSDFANFGCNKEPDELINSIISLLEPKPFMTNEEIILIEELLNDARDGKFNSNLEYYKSKWQNLNTKSDVNNLFSGFVIELTFSSANSFKPILGTEEDPEPQALINHAVCGLAVSFVASLENLYDNGGAPGKDFLKDMAFGFAYGAAGSI